MHVWRSGGSAAALFCALVPLDITEERRSTSPGGGGGGDWTRTGSKSRTGSITVALYSPLSENMSEFFLLALLALFSGLFPCAEPSAVSGEDRGKEESGPSGLRSPVKLGTAGRLRAVSFCSGRQMVCGCWL